MERFQKKCGQVVGRISEWDPRRIAGQISGNIFEVTLEEIVKKLEDDFHTKIHTELGIVEFSIGS